RDLRRHVAVPDPPIQAEAARGRLLRRFVRTESVAVMAKLGIGDQVRLRVLRRDYQDNLDTPYMWVIGEIIGKKTRLFGPKWLVFYSDKNGIDRCDVFKARDLWLAT